VRNRFGDTASSFACVGVRLEKVMLLASKNIDRLEIHGDLLVGVLGSVHPQRVLSSLDFWAAVQALTLNKPLCPAVEIIWQLLTVTFELNAGGIWTTAVGFVIIAVFVPQMKQIG
jgi:hypothetical protein